MPNFNNRVIKLKPNRVPVMDRIARSALVNCTDDEWLEIIEAAQGRGILPRELWMTDLTDFNQRAAAFTGTVREFLDQGVAND